MELVLAGSYREFTWWCAEERHCSPTDKSVRYVRSGRDLRGYSPDVAIVELPGWYRRRSRAELDDIERELAWHMAAA